MPSTFTSSLRLTLPATGENAGTWGNLVNTGITTLIDTSIAGTASITIAGTDYTLSNNNGTTDEARAMFINATGTPGAARNVICPAVSKMYIFRNNTTGGFAMTLKTSAGTGIAVPAGQSRMLYCDGTNVVESVNSFGSLSLGTSLGVASGGTGAATFTANNVLLGNGTSAFQVVAPGTNGNVLTSNGTTWTSAAIPPGGLNYIFRNTAYTAVNRDGVLADTSAGAFTVTLPATPTVGNQVVVADAGNAWGTNNLTVGRNGSTIGGLAENLVCDITGASVQLVYDGTTWEVYAQIGGQGGNVVTTAPGTSGNVLTSNGTSWISAAPTGTPALNVVTGTTQTAVASNHYVLTNVAATTVTLPATPAAGDVVWVTVGNGLTTNVVARNGQNIQSLAEDLTLNANYAAVQMRFINSTIGWTFV